MSKFVWPAECFTVHLGWEKYSLAKSVCAGFEAESYSVHGHVQVKWQFQIRWACWCQSWWTNVKGKLSLRRGLVVPWEENTFILRSCWQNILRMEPTVNELKHLKSETNSKWIRKPHNKQHWSGKLSGIWFADRPLSTRLLHLCPRGVLVLY